MDKRKYEIIYIFYYNYTLFHWYELGRDHPKRITHSYQSWKYILKILLTKQKLLNLQKVSGEDQE